MGAIGHGEHGRDAVAIGLSPEVGDAVLGDDDIAQVTRHRGIAVGPDDVGMRAPFLAARAAHGDDGARTLKLVRHGDEVVLAAGAADDAAIVEGVGGD